MRTLLVHQHFNEKKKDRESIRIICSVVDILSLG